MYPFGSSSAIFSINRHCSRSAPLRILLGLCCFTLVLLGGISSARAQQADAAPFRVALQYTTGVDECPSDQQLRQAVQAELGRDPFDDQATEQVTVAIKAQGSQLVAELGLPPRLREAARARVLSSPRGDCKELVRALALALCLVIDPLHVETDGHASTASDTDAGKAASAGQTSGSPPTSAGNGKREAVSKSATSAEEPTNVDSRSESPVNAFGQGGTHAYVQLSALGSAGLAPGVGLGAALEVGARRGALSLGIEGRLEFPRETAFQTGQVSVSPRLLSIAPCWLPAPFVACVLLSGGELVASGNGFPVNHRGHAPVFGARARVAFELPLSAHLGLRAFAETQALLDHAEFIANRSVAWQAGPLFADAGVSGVLLF